MKDKIKQSLLKPVVQLVLAILLVGGFWGWELGLKDHPKYADPIIRAVDRLPTDVLQDTTLVPPEFVDLFNILREDFASDEAFRTRTESLAVRTKADTPLYIEFILDHVASIIGSCVVITIPAFRVLKARRANKDES